MNATPQRANRRIRASTIVARSLLTLLLAIAAADGQAESIQNPGGGARATTHLDFQIVIPSMLMLDTKTGTVYSNDPQQIALLGAMDASGLGRSASAAGPRPVEAENGWKLASGRGAPGGRMATRSLANGDVVSVP